MPRRKSLVTGIREIVREQVQQPIQGLLASASPRKKAASGRRRRRRRRGLGRPPWIEDSTLNRVVSEGADADSDQEAGHGDHQNGTLSVLPESHSSVVHAAATRPGAVGKQRMGRGDVCSDPCPDPP